MKVVAVRAAMAIVMLSALAAPATAEGTFISAPNRMDVAYDDARDVLYISNGGQLLRYQVSTQTMLAPVTLGGQLSGLDISPDGNTLAVGDLTFTNTESWFYLVNLDTLAADKIAYTKGQTDREAGTFSLAYASDGTLLVTSEYQGSGSVPLLRYDPVKGKFRAIGRVNEDSMLQADASKKVIALEESQGSDGPFGKYVVKGKKLNQSGRTFAFNYEVGVDHNAKTFALMSDQGTFIADKNLALTGTMIGTTTGQPIAAAFHPTRHLVYFPWSRTVTVKVYSTDSWTEMDSFDFANTFSEPQFVGYQQGRTKLSKDGSLLFVTVDGGVRYVETAHHRR